jgi:hypothetical protein
MLFTIEEDSGTAISGYFVPDSYSAPSVIEVLASSQVVATVNATVTLPSLLTAGRHATGLCGFLVSEEVLPDLQALEVTLRDPSTGFVFYRRKRSFPVLEHQLMNFEISLARPRWLDAVLDGMFQQSFLGIDRFGQETVLQVLLLQHSSMYLGGRIAYREYEYSMSANLKKICLLPDPFLELAYTLLALTDSRANENLNFGMREQLAFEAVTAYARAINLDDERELRIAIDRMPRDVESRLTNPTARLLAARTPEETPNTSYIATSLEALSSFDIVGVAEEPETFAATLSELLGHHVGSFDFPRLDDRAIALGQRLRAITSAERLLFLDLELYESVRAATESSADEVEQNAN